MAVRGGSLESQKTLARAQPAFLTGSRDHGLRDLARQRYCVPPPILDVLARGEKAMAGQRSSQVRAGFRRPFPVDRSHRPRRAPPSGLIDPASWYGTAG